MRRFFSLLLLATCLCTPVLAAQQVVVLSCHPGEKPNLAEVNSLLDAGWTVQLVTSCATTTATNGMYDAGVYFTFVLSRPDSTPPPPAGASSLSP